MDNPHDPPCVRCKRERKECIFTDSSRRGGNRTANVSAVAVDQAYVTKSMQDAITSVMIVGGSHEPYKSDTKQLPPLGEIKMSSEINTMQSALEFLAKAAGSVAREDSRDQMDADSKYELLESRDTTPANSMPDSGKLNGLDLSDESLFAPLVRPHGSKRATIPLIEKLSSIRPKPSTQLTDIEYIGPSKLLSEEEAMYLIDLFFLTMHPFFPHIPLQLQNPQELCQYPILICAILTISSRYHSLSKNIGDNDDESGRNIEVHERLWIYCQRLISQTVWAEASTRSLGTVLAFLLFTEWNPRAIHWRWSDYANNPDLNDVSKRDVPNNVQPQQSEESLTGLGAMRRSDRMAWMLTGTAVRLAQDMGFMNRSSKIFVAAHISETHTAMNMNQRSILSQSLSEVSLNGYESGVQNESFYLDKILVNDSSKERWSKFLQRLGTTSSKDGKLTDIEREFLNDEYILYHRNKDARAHNGNDLLVGYQPEEDEERELNFSFGQRAKIELLRIMSIGYETIYCGKVKLYPNDQRHNLAVLSILSPLIEGWYNTYKKLLVPCGGMPCQLEHCTNKRQVFEIAKKIDCESLISDYYYCQLYIYSLALQVDTNATKEKRLKLNDVTKSARYVELAYNAAKEILSSSVRVHKLRMLKYMPVRWVTRIVRAVAFVVKCYLTLTGGGIATNPEANTILTLTVIPTEEIIQTIQRVAITLREASPDELHLCTRYSTILMYLCTELKLRSQPNPQPPVPRSISADHMLRQQQEQYGDRRSQNGSALNEPAPAEPDVQEQPADFCFPTLLDDKPTSSGQTQVLDWFLTSEDIGLDFVEPWTEMIERQFISQDDTKTFESLYNQATGHEFQLGSKD